MNEAYSNKEIVRNHLKMDFFFLVDKFGIYFWLYISLGGQR